VADGRGSAQSRWTAAVNSLWGGAALYLASIAYLAADAGALGGFRLLALVATAAAHAMTGFIAIGGPAAIAVRARGTALACALLSIAVAATGLALAMALATLLPVPLAPTTAVIVGCAAALASIATSSCALLRALSRWSN